MARLVGGDFSEERPKLQWSQESKDWFEPIARGRWVENRERDRADPLFPRSNGGSLGLGNGLLFPEPPDPLRIKLKKLPGNVLSDFLDGFGTVSDRIKVKIEELEPSVHQFLPLEVEMLDSSISEERYWAFCNMNVLDTLVLEKSEFMYEKWPNKERMPEYSRYRGFGDHINKPVWALDKATIAGKVCWVDYKIEIGPLFFSDEFASWLDAEGIKGWEANDGRSRRTTIIEV